MISVMFWNLCKSSWRKELYLFVFGVLVIVSASQDGQPSSSKSNVRLENCGKLYEGHSLNAGKDAGKFKRIGDSRNPMECVELCCALGESGDCKTALYVGELKACYKVECKSEEACKPIEKHSKYDMSIFKRSTKGLKNADESQSSVNRLNDDSNKTLIREKRHESCHHYHGRQCTSFLDTKRLLYFDHYPPKSIELGLKGPFKSLRTKLSPKCRASVLSAICHNAFPYCTDRSHPSPARLCRSDCEKLYKGVCSSELLGLMAQEVKILPNCTLLPPQGSPEAADCTGLNIPDPTAAKSRPVIAPKPSNNKPNPEQANVSSDDEEELGSFKNQINKPEAQIEPHEKSVSDITDDNNEESSRSRSNGDTDSTIPKPSAVSHHVSSNLPSPKVQEPTKRPSKQVTELKAGATQPTAATKKAGLDLEKSMDGLDPVSPTEGATAGITAKDDDDSDDESDTKNDDDDVVRDVVPTVRVKHTAPPTAVQTTIPIGNNASVINKPTIVNITGDSKETNLAETESPSPTKQPTTAPVTHANGSAPATTPAAPTTDVSERPTTRTTPAPPSLLVSAGDNKVLTLPVNSIELYASAFPKETIDNHYTYHWQQISAPQGSHGYMEGKDTRRVILSKLSHIGTYQFKVTVTGANHAFGVAHVNVTVKPAPRVNKPPRADISPKEQTITLPTNEVVLDGSKSTDDDKIVEYKWEEMKGPLNDKNKMISQGADSPVLQLKSLVPGIYTFKLTVSDSDGETDSTTAVVTVNDEKDYPPVARAGNDVVLTLPVNHVVLYGNSSTDDKGIASYEWSKTPSSPAVGDMQGTNSPQLKVSNMVLGDYTFVLKVTDTGGQSATSRVTVVVQPEKNTPPVAKAGSDKDLVYPDDTTTLDAKGSYDDQKIVKYHWDQVSGPSSAEMSGADNQVVEVKKLTEGHYVFKLTVTDDKGLTGSGTVAVNVKKDVNQAPVARAGPDVVVHLPNRAAELDGSKSSDDHGIAQYLWTRDAKSPAAGDVINSSNHQAILRLSNLVEGMYKFKLTVLDAKGLKSSDEALLTVKEDEHSAHLVELFLDVDITKFTEENKGQLIRKLAVILDVQDEEIVVEHLKEAGTGHSMMVMFYVKAVGGAKDGQAVAETLKEKIENEEGFFEFRMLKVEPYICRNNCSFHGYCDRSTKLCVCESFWMQDIFKSSFGAKESNCDWSILYVTVIIFGIVMAIGGIIWGICFCMGRSRRLRARKVVAVEAPTIPSTSASESPGRRLRTRRKHRYAIIDEDEHDRTESMEMLPKGKYSSLMLSDSYDESDDESTIFEAKKKVMNGNANGGIGNKHF
ncbi:dyslexia-associated protein KIAA0319-like protein isoform X3 [Nematostella vectensis]|uniref:dyslexia-associated protein KIAA0319-like protein isoform X3 n=1 Tax=Nematostella vectensis TaxID=45351 RepID=UPI002077729F|nr:dyslexia-associated protein KIAA0319-like protein isoform X3 [Nematostella vectensis]